MRRCRQIGRRRGVTAGYSGTPLARKLGMTPPMKWLAIDPPSEYRAWLGAIPKGVAIAMQGGGNELQAVHVFVTKRVALEKHLADLRRRLKPTGFVWVSWPKKASKLETDVTEDAIRAVALPLGFVDVKVCAVSQVWSGLKLVIRKSERARNGARP